MNNYFGIGLDAKISLDFNNKRDEHPEKCRWVMARGGGGAVPEQAGSGMESGPVAAFPRAGGCRSRRPTRKRLSGGLVVGRFHVGTGSGKAEEEESACSEDEEPGDKLSQSSCVWLPQLEPAPAGAGAARRADCGPQAQPWVPRFPFSLLLVHLGRWHGMAQVPGPCTLMGDLGGILGYWLCFVPALAAMGIWGVNLRIEKLSVSSSAFLQIPKEQAV